MDALCKVKLVKRGLIRLEKTVLEFSTVEKRLRDSESYLHVCSKELTRDFDEITGFDQAIIAEGDEDDPDVADYIAEAYYEKYKSLYLLHITLLHDSLKAVTQPVVDNSSTMYDNVARHNSTFHMSSTRQCNETVSVTHPSIKIEPFDGDYSKWYEFKTLFESSVHKNPNYNDGLKLNLLQSYLRGRALKVIRRNRETLNSENYSSVWDMLIKRYDHKRTLVQSYFEDLCFQKVLEKETATDLEELHDTTWDSIGALKSMDMKTDDWEDMLAFIVQSKLPSHTRQLWDQELGSSQEWPKFGKLMNFIETRFRSLMNMQSTKVRTSGNYNHFNESSSRYTNKRTTLKTNSEQAFKSCKPICKICKTMSHALRFCEKFKSFAAEERLNLVKKNGYCINCLATQHRVANCKSSFRCSVCTKKHHSLLHFGQGTGNLQPDEVSALGPSTSSNFLTTLFTKESSSVIFPTAVVKINGHKKSYLLRAIIDPCSDGSYITESAANNLQLPRSKHIVHTSGLSDVVTVSSQHITSFVIHSIRDSMFSREVQAHIVSSISSQRSSISCDIEFPDIEELELADPGFMKSEPIDLLLGGDIDALITMGRLKKSQINNIVLKETRLGWIVNGSIPVRNCFRSSKREGIDVLENLEKSIKRFWEYEEIPTSRTLTEDERKAEEFYERTTYRLPDGKYVVKLAFKTDIREFTNMHQIATGRFLSLEKKFERFPDLKDSYSDCLKEYLQLDHMCRVDSSVYSNPYYIPHHNVVKPDSTTTPNRVVFDASCKDSKGHSLNNQLLTGPRLQGDLLDLLIKFRTFRVALTADIEKMYRQIWINGEDQKFQLILFRQDESEKIETFALKTLTFGTASAPYLAIKTLYQLAKDEENRFPIGAKSLRQGFYVDDFIYGGDNEFEAAEIKNETIKILRSAGFHLRKWSSNTPKLLDDIPEKDKEVQSILSFDKKQAIKTLGIYWSPQSDEFFFKVIITEHKVHTKCTVLSDISKIFDPLGWISPCIILTKLIMQQLWLQEYGWDTPLSSDILKKWLNLREQLKLLSNIRLPRWVGTFKESRVEFHGFSNASEKAYAAVIYVRSVTHGKENIELLISKTRVAPLKCISLPKLELNAAVLLAKLLSHVIHVLQLTQYTYYCWSDSTITLSWIKDHPHKRTTYIANRVAEIQALTKPECWSYVKTDENPADLGTRGVFPIELQENSMWWHGPSFLQQFDYSKHTFPKGKILLPEEYDKKTHMSVTQRNTSPIHCFLTKRKISVQEAACNLQDFPNNDVFQRFSTLSKLCRVIAYCKRVIKRNRSTSIYISIAEYNTSLKTILRLVQRECFATEYAILEEGKSLSKSSNLLCLSPYIDLKDKLLRVNSRIGNAVHISYDQRFPIILPYNHLISELIVREAHNRTFHGTIQQTWMFVTQKYHIIRCKSLIRKITHTCVKCFRFKCHTQTQQMAQLPVSRITPERAFTECGVDLAGPFEVKKWKGKCNRFYKSYFAIFVCFSTKAVHLEVVVDLSSNEFILAFKRFVSRRGIPSTMYSDCGKNFIGSESYLTRSRQAVVEKWNHDMSNLLSNFQTTWKFNPPSSPHFGGLWEAGVKSAKRHLKRVMGNAKLSYDEFETLLVQVEACLNSRPLCQLDGDPNTVVLTPGHFLIQAPLNAIPEFDVARRKLSHIDRWKYLLQLYQDFWKLWSQEYLNTLRQRTKWRKKCPNIRENDIVLVKENNLPPSTWVLARVIKLHVGADNLVRVVTIQTGQNTYKRPIVKLCPLPIA